MREKSSKPAFNLVFSLILTLVVNLAVLNDVYNHLLVLLWLLSLALIIIPFLPKLKHRHYRFNLKAGYLLVGFLLLLPVLIRIVNIDIERIHDDEFIPAYFSAHYDLKNTNFFAAIPTEKGWVTQFPSPYFVFQKLFFMFFGESPLTVKLSVMPYVLTVSLLLFLIVKKLFNFETAMISLVLYSFFAPALYLETLGLHFISSSAVFLIFFYLAILVRRQNRPFFAVLAGIFAGFCYLFYTSSYIALPFLFLFYGDLLLRERERTQTLRNLALSVLAFLIVISPFVSFAYRFKNPYFLERHNQVNILTGQWSAAKEEGPSILKATSILRKSFLDSLSSFYQDDIGGHGGYEFGRLAFFERFSLFLFILGFAISLAIMKGKPEVLFILLVILVSFVGGMVLTIQPPAFHRFSLAYPFIVIIFSLPFYIFLSVRRKDRPVTYLLVFLVLFIFVVANRQYFLKSIKRDIKNNREDLKDIKVIKYIEQYYPERKVYIAAFPTHGLGRVFYFFERSKKVEVDYHDTLISKINPEEKYLYIILFPDQFNEKFKEADENGRIIDDVVDKYSLFVN